MTQNPHWQRNLFGNFALLTLGILNDFEPMVEIVTTVTENYTHMAWDWGKCRFVLVIEECLEDSTWHYAIAGKQIDLEKDIGFLGDFDGIRAGADALYSICFLGES